MTSVTNEAEEESVASPSSITIIEQPSEPDPWYNVALDQLDFIAALSVISWILFNGLIKPHAVFIQDKLFNKHIDKSSKGIGILNQILNRVNCDRVIVTIPHNGSVFITGDHLWKLTAEYEAVRSGYTDARMSFQNIPGNALIKVLTKFRNPDEVSVARYSAEDHNESIDGWLANWMLNSGVDYAVILPLYSNESDQDGDITALLHIHWLNGQTANRQKFETFDTLQIYRQMKELRAVIMDVRRKKAQNMWAKMFMRLVNTDSNNNSR